ncbi:carbohydrate ABC transporter permease [Limnochorda pilosa]|uniref:carbohydrate ABC transporter permease n=1 Tax=Limnochorda pilosa TaxID=1555112 RepID=UPI000835756C|nr:sugar ABC transporter permease [Limnochorda pilosa]
MRRPTGGREEKPRLLLAIPLAVLAVIAFVPLFYAIYIAVHDVYLTRNLGTAFVGLDNFVRVLTTSRGLHAFAVTFELVIISVAVELLLGLAMAVLIQRAFPGKSWLVTLVVLPMTIPKVVAALVWNVLLDPLVGVINYFLGIVGLPLVDWLADPDVALFSVAMVDIWQWTPFIILILLAGLGTIPREPYEAAELEGATAWRTFRGITLPLLKPFITIAVIFRTIDAMRTFDYVYVLTKGGPGLATETVDLYAYKMGIAEAGDISSATAAAILLLVLTLIITTLWVRAMRWGEELY